MARRVSPTSVACARRTKPYWLAGLLVATEIELRTIVPTTPPAIRSMLVVLHTGSNEGYAIAPLERVFLAAARRVVGADSRIHFAYKNLKRGFPGTLPHGFQNVVALDIRDHSRAASHRVEQYVRAHQIDGTLVFDGNVTGPNYRALRRGGVRTLVSYWGAPMSSLNSGLKLLLKRLEVRLRRDGPDCRRQPQDTALETSSFTHLVS